MICSAVGVLALAMLFKMMKRQPPKASWAPLSIGLAFWQQVALFKHIHLNWPPALRHAFDFMSLANMNIAGLQTECLISLPYDIVLFLVLAMPILVWVLVCLVGAVVQGALPELRRLHIHYCICAWDQQIP
jgi:hypothetical protein